MTRGEFVVSSVVMYCLDNLLCGVRSSFSDVSLLEIFLIACEMMNEYIGNMFCPCSWCCSVM
jgi:hypothetical protein